MQLPIALQLGGICQVFPCELLVNMSWVVAYILFALPTFILLYYFGKLFEVMYTLGREN